MSQRQGAGTQRMQNAAQRMQAGLERGALVSGIVQYPLASGADLSWSGAAAQPWPPDLLRRRPSPTAGCSEAVDSERQRGHVGHGRVAQAAG